MKCRKAAKKQEDIVDTQVDSATETAELEAIAKFRDAMYALAAGSIDRAREGADVVQKASAAIATLYTGALALVFSVTSNPLPVRGILTPIFLGLAVALSTGYIAWTAPTKDSVPVPGILVKDAEGIRTKPKQDTTFEQQSNARIDLFTTVSSAVATRRSGLLRASVVSLGVGLIWLIRDEGVAVV